jgi:hypothetical protein
MNLPYLVIYDDDIEILIVKTRHFYDTGYIAIITN